MYSVLSLSERLSVHMGSCLFLLVWGLRFWASGCLSCVFHALDHWSENRHLGVSTALVGTGHDAKKAEKVKAGFEEITGDERRTLSWSGNMAKEKEGPQEDKHRCGGGDGCTRSQERAAVPLPWPQVASSLISHDSNFAPLSLP